MRIRRVLVTPTPTPPPHLSKILYPPLLIIILRTGLYTDDRDTKVYDDAKVHVIYF